MRNAVEREQLMEKVRQVLLNNIVAAPDTITGSSRLLEDLNIDSFDALRLIFDVEEEFDIKVPPTELPGIKTVDDAVDYLFSRISSSPVR